MYRTELDGGPDANKKDVEVNASFYRRPTRWDDAAASASTTRRPRRRRSIGLGFVVSDIEGSDWSLDPADGRRDVVCRTLQRLYRAARRPDVAEQPDALAALAEHVDPVAE